MDYSGVSAAFQTYSSDQVFEECLLQLNILQNVVDSPVVQELLNVHEVHGLEVERSDLPVSKCADDYIIIRMNVTSTSLPL